MSQQVETIDIPVGLSEFKPTKFAPGVNFSLIHARCEPPIKRITKTGHEGDARLYDRELLHIQQTALSRTIEDHDLKNRAIMVGKDRFMMQGGAGAASVDGVADKMYSAVVCVWNGRGFPPDELDEQLDDDGVFDFLPTRVDPIVKWERFYHESGRTKEQKRLDKARGKSAPVHHTGLRFRWTKVELYGHDEKFMTHNHLQRMMDHYADSMDTSQLQLYHVTVRMVNVANEKLSDIIHQVYDNTHMNARDFTRQMIKAIMQFEYSTKGLVVYGDKYFDVDKNERRPVRNLDLIQGHDRHLRVNALKQPILMEGQIQKLFLPEQTVSDFVLQYFGDVSATTFRSGYEARLRQTLRGRIVKFKTSMGWEKRPVHDIAQYSGKEAKDDDKHVCWRGKGDKLLEHPELLCLDLGSQRYAALMPPELCIIEPKQSFNGYRSSDIKSALRKLNTIAAAAPMNEIKDDAYISEYAPEQRQLGVLNQELSNTFGDRGITFLFIEAGVSRVNSVLWSQYRNYLANSKILDNCEIRVRQAAEPLFLQYHPEHDVEEPWTALLQKGINEQPQIDGKTPTLVIVASVQDDQYNSQIYNLLKYIAECRVGQQLFTVNLENMVRKARQFGKKGALKVANETINRIRIRNPTPPAARPAGFKDIAVALHIECKVVDGSKINAHGPKTEPKKVYVVTMSSRGFDTTTDYKTKVLPLKAQSQIETYNPADDVCDFIEDLIPRTGVHQHRITILRTGYMPAASNARDGAPQGRKATEHEYFDPGNYHLRCSSQRDGTVAALNVQSDADTAGTANEGRMPEPSHATASLVTEDVGSIDMDGKSQRSSRARQANNEYALIHNAICKKPPTRGALVSYILLSEDDSFKLSAEAIERISHRVQAKVSREGDEDDDDSKAARRAKAHFFVADTNFMYGNDYTVGVHRNVMAGNNKLIRAELLGERLDSRMDDRTKKGPGQDRDPYAETRDQAQAEEKLAKLQSELPAFQALLGLHAQQTGQQEPEPEPERKPLGTISGNNSPTVRDGRRFSSARKNSDRRGPSGEFPKHRLAEQENPYSTGSALSSPQTPNANGLQICEDATMTSGSKPLIVPSNHQTPVSVTSTRKPPKMASTQVMPKTSITYHELERLAKLWRDDRMELYNTKWPIPTHMAYLAAKRALFHLRMDKWEDDGEDDQGPAPFSLAPVKDDVAGSLWYL